MALPKKMIHRNSCGRPLNRTVVFAAPMDPLPWAPLQPRVPKTVVASVMVVSRITVAASMTGARGVAATVPTSEEVAPETPRSAKVWATPPSSSPTSWLVVAPVLSGTLVQSSTQVSPPSLLMRYS